MITATAPPDDVSQHPTCTGCRGSKGAPIAAIVDIDGGAHDMLGGRNVRIALCEECGRDLANVVAFMCIRDGGWSKLEPRRTRRPGKAARR